MDIRKIIGNIVKIKFSVLFSLIGLILLPSCEIIRRGPIRTDILRGQAETEHAKANILNAQARITNDFALCLESRAPKGVRSTIPVDCGQQPTSSIQVTITDSNKKGEVPALALTPPIPGAAFLGTLLGDQ